MENRIKSLVSLLFMLAPLCAQAAPVQEVVTPGGIRAWLMEERSLPLVAVKILYSNAGTAYDPDGKEGRAMLVSALLLEGAGGLDSVAFHEALESKAIVLNTSADEDHFVVSMQSLKEHQEEAFRLLGLAVSHPRFDADALERSRDELQSALLQMEKTPAYRLQRAWLTHSFPSHPYSKPANGARQSLESLKIADMEAYHQRYLTRGNMIIGISGDITPQEASRLLDAHLGELPKDYRPEKEIAETTPQPIPKPIILNSDIPQTLVAFGGAAVKRDDPAYFDALILHYLLGGESTLISRLGMAIREQRGLAYYANTSMQPFRHAGTWKGSFATRNDKVAEALQVLEETLQKMRTQGITDDELRGAKKYLTGSFPLSLESNAAVANFLVAMQLHNLGRDYLDRRNGLVEAVTKEGVNRMAKTMLDPEHLSVIMIGKPEGMEAGTYATQ